MSAAAIPDAARPVVGFIGLGAMGGPMSANLQKAGYRIVVNDVRREAAAAHEQAGATWADSPRALAAQCEVVFSCLPTAAVIETVALGPDGVLAGIRRGSAYFEMSTSTPELVRQVHAAFAERGAQMLDTPISGGPQGAHSGRLAIWAGGDKATYQRCAPVLRAMGDYPVHVGAIGAGLVTKLVHNCTSQTTQAAIAEAFVLGVKAGADPLALWEAIRQGTTGRRRLFDGLADQFLPARFEPAGAALRTMHGNLLAATELGRDLGVPMRFANLALADLQEAMGRGWAERDGHSVMLLPQERAGIRVGTSPEAIREVLRRDAPAASAAGAGPLGGLAKLVHDCASLTTQAGIAEVFIMGVKAGADPLGLWEGVRTGMIGRRRTFDDLIDEFLPGNYDRIQAPLNVVYKDMKSATGFARTLGVPMRFASLAFADIQEAMTRGWAERDRRTVMLLPQERAGVHIQADPAAIRDVLRRDPPARSDVKHGAGV